jgi:hypothetical protein
MCRIVCCQIFITRRPNFLKRVFVVLLSLCRLFPFRHPIYLTEKPSISAQTKNLPGLFVKCFRRIEPLKAINALNSDLKRFRPFSTLRTGMFPISSLVGLFKMGVKGSDDTYETRLFKMRVKRGDTYETRAASNESLSVKEF